MAQLSTFVLCAFLTVLTAKAQPLGQVLPQCQWQVTLKTGDQQYAATNANIDMKIHLSPAATGIGVLDPEYTVLNLSQHGGRGPHFAYFRRNATDVFQFMGPCDPLFCTVSLHNDGTGGEPYWFLVSAGVSVDVPVAGKMAKEAIVNRWLANVSPYSWDVNINFCSQIVPENGPVKNIGETQSVKN